MEKFIQLLWLISWPVLVAISYFLIKKYIRKYEQKYDQMTTHKTDS